MPDIRETDKISDLLDPPEDPISEGGNWSTVDTYGHLKKSGTDLTSSLDDAIGFAYWTPETFDTYPIEIWGMPGGGQLGAALEDWRLALWTVITPVRGYMIGFGGGIDKFWFFRRYDGGRGTFTDIWGATDSYPSGMMMRIIDANNIEIWGSWDDGANWTLVQTISESTYRGAFYLSWGIEDPTSGGLYFSTIGGGEVEFIPQIYRRPNE